MIAIGLSVAALAVAVPALQTLSKQSEEEFQLDPKPDVMPMDEQFVLYLGTNDKDTNEPVFSPEEAKTKAEEILLDKFGGYTIQEANGGWIDGETTYREYTLVIHLSDTTLDKVHDAADELIETFHQSSVLIQSYQTVTDFYSEKE